MFSKFLSHCRCLLVKMFSEQKIVSCEPDHLRELRELSVRYSVPEYERKRMFLVW
ncbi:MAG: hypothetical protein HQK49_21860 [Oligoflexia bacterium]|nr:hypothetical protein [Oligoflexia bacterium]